MATAVYCYRGTAVRADFSHFSGMAEPPFSSPARAVFRPANSDSPAVRGLLASSSSGKEAPLSTRDGAKRRTSDDSAMPRGDRSARVLAASVVTPVRAPEKETPGGPVVSLPQIPQRQKKPTSVEQLSSDVWTHHGGCFVPYFDNYTGKLAGGNCTACTKQFRFKERSGTTMMRLHMTKTHKMSSQPHDTILNSALTPEKQWRADRALAVAMLMNGWAIRTPDTVGFQFLAEEIKPEWHPACRTTIMNKHVEHLYELIGKRFDLSKFKNSELTVIFDGWKAGKPKGSTRHRGFLGVALHVIDTSWTPQLFTLGVRRMVGHHGTTEMLACLTDLLRSYGILPTQLMSSVTDNHTTECCVGRLLVQQGAGHHTRCFAHTLDLAVNDVFEGSVTVNPVAYGNKVYKIVHATVTLFSSKRLLADALETQQARAGVGVPISLVVDVETRWNSIYDMMQRLWDMRSHVDAVLRSFTGGDAQSVQIARARAEYLEIVNDIPFMLNILADCKDMSEIMEANDSFLSTLLPNVCYLAQRLTVCCPWHCRLPHLMTVFYCFAAGNRRSAHGDL